MILLFFLVSVLAQNHDSVDRHIELKIDKLYEFYGKVPTTTGQNSIQYPTHFYKFTINNIIPNEDLYVILKAIEDKNTYPALYISHTNPFPSVNNSESCGLDGLDVCIIEDSEIQMNATYYLAVYCTKNCHFTLKIHYQAEYDISAGDGVIINFIDTTDEELKVILPRNMENVDRVIIRAHLLAEKGTQLKETFHFYVSEGNTPPTPAKYDYSAEPIWLIGKGVVIHKNNSNLLPNSNLTITIVAYESARIYLTTNMFTEIREVRLFETIEDIVAPLDSNTYRLVIEPQYLELLDKNSLSIDIHPYEGNPDVYITYPPLPTSLDKYQWQSQLDQGFESITISPFIRDRYSDDKEFYITMKANEEFSSYSFFIYASNYLSRLLMPMSTESGFLVAGERIEYKVYVNEYESNHYVIGAVYPSGDAFLALKKCSKNTTEVSQVTDPYRYIQSANSNNYYNCKLTDEQINKIQIGVTLQEETAQIFSDETQIRFFYNKTECQEHVLALEFEQEPSNCLYMLTVVSKRNSRDIKYTISIKGKDQLVKLVEGQMRRSLLLEYERDFYVFKNEDPDAVKVVFQITVINGELDVYSSRTVEFPNEKNFENAVSGELDLLSFTSDLIGSYYIGVHSRSICRYTITALVIRKTDEKHASSAIRLTEGQVQKHQQSSIDEASHFYFDVDFKDPQPFFIHLNSIYGDFEAYIGLYTAIGESFPNENYYDYFLESQLQTLIILPTDQKYKQAATIKITVCSSSLSSQEVFEISYSTQFSLIDLKYGQPHYTALDHTHTSYFRFFNNYSLEYLFILKALLSQQDQQNYSILYISDTNPFPSANDYKYKMNGTMLTIKNPISERYIYISVQSIGYNELTLLVRGVESVVEIKDNQILNLPMPTHKLYPEAHMYFHITSNKSVKVQTYTKFAEITILGKIVDYQSAIQSIRAQNLSQFPTKQDYTIKEKETDLFQSKLLLIPPNQTQQCLSFPRGCLLLLSVRITQDSIFNTLFGDSYDDIDRVNNILGEDGYFSIQISQETIQIRSGDVIVGYSSDDIISYYYLSVYYPVSMIQIMVRPLDDGDPDIYIKRQLDPEKEVYPTESDYDFNSIQYQTDVLILDQSNFTDGNNSGEYIIGVLGFQSSVTFELSVTLADIRLFTILTNQELKHVNVFSNVYLQFHHKSAHAFRILIDGIQYVDVAVNSYKNHLSNEGFLESLPFFNESVTTYGFKLEHNSNLFGGILHIQGTESGFCFYCTYLIGIKPLQAEADISVLVIDDSQPFYLEKGQTYYDEATSSGVHYAIESTAQDTEVKIQIYSGEFQAYLRKGQPASSRIFDQIILGNTFIILELKEAGDYFLFVKPIEEKVQFTIQVTDPLQPVELSLRKFYSSMGTSEFVFRPLSAIDAYVISMNHKEEARFDLFSKLKGDEHYELVTPLESQETSYQKQSTYLLQEKQLLYKVIVTTNGNFSIVINADNLKYLQANTQQVEVLRQNLTQKYEMFGQDNQVMSLELKDCIGETKLSSQYFSGNQYSFQADSDVFFLVEGEKSVSYMIEGQKEHRVVYYLVAHLAKQQEVWTTKQLTPIFINQTQAGGISIAYAPHLSQENGTEVEMLIYTLYYSNSKEHLAAFSSCGMSIDQLKNYQIGPRAEKIYIEKKTQILQKSSSRNLEFETPKLAYSQVYLQLVLQVYYKAIDAPYTYWYHLAEYKFENHSDHTITEPPVDWTVDNQFLIYIGIGTVAILAFIIVVICVCRRKGRSQGQQKGNKNINQNDEEGEAVNEPQKTE